MEVTTETTDATTVVPTFGYAETFSVLTDRLKSLLTEMKSMKKELDTLRRTTAKTLKKSQSKSRTSRTKKSCRNRSAFNVSRICGHQNIYQKLSNKKKSNSLKKK